MSHLKYKVLLVSHYTEVPGVMEKVASFLEGQDFHLSYILNPLFPRSDLKSIIKSRNVDIKYKLPWYGQYLIEGIVGYFKFKYSVKQISSLDLAVCFDPLSFLEMIAFKKLLRIKKVVYYNVDYSTRRYKNIALNFIYNCMNKFAYVKSDYFLSLSRKYIEDIDPGKKYASKSFLLRHTVSLGDYQNVKKIPNSLVYAGSLSRTVNFSDFLLSLHDLKEEGIDFTCDIYGQGDQLKSIQKLTSELSLSNRVNFKGVVSHDVLTRNVLPKYIIGVCPYIKKGTKVEADHMFTGTDLTTKLVEYLAAKLPIVTTELYDAFRAVEQNQIGFLVKNQHDWHMSLKKLLSDRLLQEKYSENAYEYSKNYDENMVLGPVFKHMLGEG